MSLHHVGHDRQPQPGARSAARLGGPEEPVEDPFPVLGCDPRTPVGDLETLLDIPPFPDDDQFETIAGFLMYVLRKVPRYVVYPKTHYATTRESTLNAIETTRT